jgi:hypothetical protein
LIPEFESLINENDLNFSLISQDEARDRYNEARLRFNVSDEDKLSRSQITKKMAELHGSRNSIDMLVTSFSGYDARLWLLASISNTRMLQFLNNDEGSYATMSVKRVLNGMLNSLRNRVNEKNKERESQGRRKLKITDNDIVDRIRDLLKREINLYGSVMTMEIAVIKHGEKGEVTVYHPNRVNNAEVFQEGIYNHLKQELKNDWYKNLWKLGSAHIGIKNIGVEKLSRILGIKPTIISSMSDVEIRDAYVDIMEFIETDEFKKLRSSDKKAMRLSTFIMKEINNGKFVEDMVTRTVGLNTTTATYEGENGEFKMAIRLDGHLQKVAERVQKAEHSIR